MPAPVSNNVPDVLKPYLFHGLEVLSRSGDEHVMECPFCGREKFSLHAKKETWRCNYCDERGNASTFVQKLHETCRQERQDYSSLLAMKGFTKPEVLSDWGIVRSPLTKRWLVPGYNTEGKLCNLYQYMKFSDGWRLLPTPTLGLHMFGLHLVDYTKSTFYLCEGVWDGGKLYEELGRINREFLPTSDYRHSQLADSNVVAVPGCRTFKEQWALVFAGKIVVIMFDNDHPIPHPKISNRMLPPPSYEGAKRVAQILMASAKPPEELYYLAWGGEEPFNPALKHGYDVRDHILNN